MIRRWRVRPADRPAGRQVSAKLTDEGSLVLRPAAASSLPPEDTPPLAFPLRGRCPRRGRMRCRRAAAQNSPVPAAAGAGAISRHLARERVSDGSLLSTATKVTKSAGRNCVSALPQRAIPGSDLLRILASIAFCRRYRIKGLCLRSPARRLPRPLAPATVGVFRSYRRTPKPSP